MLHKVGLFFSLPSIFLSVSGPLYFTGVFGCSNSLIFLLTFEHCFLIPALWEREGLNMEMGLERGKDDTSPFGFSLFFH